MSAAIAPGFADPIFDSQSTFRSILQALARPGVVSPLALSLDPPAPLAPELAAVALALTDADAAIWLAPTLAAAPAVASYLRFHTGAPIVADPAEAAFALAADPCEAPPLSALNLGTDLYPDRSITLVLAVETLTGGAPTRLAGPGIRDEIAFSPGPLPTGFLAAILRANAASFPRGVDCLFVAPGAVLGLPRSSRAIGGNG